jgi:hypothetical protein
LSLVRFRRSGQAHQAFTQRRHVRTLPEQPSARRAATELVPSCCDERGHLTAHRFRAHLDRGHVALQATREPLSPIRRRVRTQNLHELLVWIRRDNEVNGSTATRCQRCVARQQDPLLAQRKLDEYVVASLDRVRAIHAERPQVPSKRAQHRVADEASRDYCCSTVGSERRVGLSSRKPRA